MDRIAERRHHRVEHFSLDELLLAVHEELSESRASPVVVVQLVADLAGTLEPKPALLCPRGEDAHVLAVAIILLASIVTVGLGKFVVSLDCFWFLGRILEPVHRADALLPLVLVILANEL